jgi:hypothetical protein
MPSGKQAAIAGLADWPVERKWDRPMFQLEAYARHIREALDDVGMEVGARLPTLILNWYEGARLWSAQSTFLAEAELIRVAESSRVPPS